jgi:hypothetical protein
VGAYVLYADDGDEVVAISIWDSAEACHRYRDSDVEARRQAPMDPFVLEERSRFYTGRELGVPGRKSPTKHAAASRRTSGLPPGSRRRSRSSWTTRSGAAVAGHLTQSRCSSQRASVSTPLRRAPAWDEQRVRRLGGMDARDRD